ncbi:hypothetical protein J18TS1_04320 [Oceanobacillus oncorhynchi subsp. incaldanensis]|uniref:Uncharacterized protein n=2 Tax=Oceanobacillus TaxID=182709 RepID=A0A0A1MXU6_9BACI|nr:hypothetical protein [Oceanobacillus oncorhynchi]MDM8101878.1 hypothetical protein [Oceanobacillus oncorhynchi]UUI42094.1 hypothetical protein NP440_11460 [Oceanobacillus oncorhynchi]GIO17332.1 hypothetical protein J18TS1_04320 [Oceanobacillus oncorhynchi subsp. incaldanensis]CEI83621.1 hypothetical protein BN997_03538 [Oceanobacillus oncorhynchi]
MKQDYIYLLFTNTGTLLTKAISLYTKAEYNHVSLALDLELNEIYSFGRKHLRNPFWGGFVKENTEEELFQKADCSIYAYAISSKQNKKLQETLAFFKQRKDNYHYNVIGLFGVMFNKPIPRSNAYFCSQFVAYLLMEAGMVSFDKPPELITPQDIQQLPGLISIYQGKLQGAV